MGFTLPRERVKYRIRNLDYRDCLEQRPSEEGVVLRPEHDDPLQHWTFSFINPRNRTFKIFNASSDSDEEQLSLYLAFTPTANNPTMYTLKYGTPEPGNNDQEVWKFIPDPLKNEKTFIVAGRSMLHMVNRDKLDLRAEINEYTIRTQPRGPDYTWELIEVSPSELPPGQNQRYRIRTLNGQALQFDSSNKLTLDREDRRGNRRIWLIKDLGNGSATIFNEESRKYLTARDRGSYEWEPTVMAEGDFQTEDDKLWDIKPTSGFSYSIFTKRKVIYLSNVVDQTLSLALDKGNAILKPKKAAHNQIWLIEPEDAPITGGEDGSDTTTPDDPAPTITAGDYKLANMGTQGYYMRILKRGDSYLFVASAPTGANKFKVELRPGGFVLHSQLNSKKIYLATNSTGDAVVGQEDVEYVWTVMKKDNNNDQYFIINTDGKVLTSPSDRNSALTLGARSQDAKQVWQFI